MKRDCPVWLVQQERKPYYQKDNQGKGLNIKRGAKRGHANSSSDNHRSTKRGRFDMRGRGRGRGRAGRVYGNRGGRGQNSSNQRLGQNTGESGAKINKGENTLKTVITLSNALHTSVRDDKASKTKRDGERIAIISRFLADSGATEHLTNSRVIFKKFNDSDKGVIRCANKNRSADLNSEGSGIVEINQANNKTLLTNWITLFVLNHCRKTCCHCVDSHKWVRVFTLTMRK